MARFVIKDGGEVKASDSARSSFRIKQPASFRIKETEPRNDLQGSGLPSLAGESAAGPASGASLRLLVAPTTLEARSQQGKPIFLHRANGQVETEAARSGLLGSITDAFHGTFGQLFRTTTTAAYQVALDENAKFSQVFTLYDRAATGDFKARITFTAWVRNSTEAIKGLVKLVHDEGGIDAMVRGTIVRKLKSLETTTTRPLVDAILDTDEVVRGLREVLQATGIAIDGLTITPLVPSGRSRFIIENLDSIAVRLQRSEARVPIGYKLELVGDSAQRSRLYVNQVPFDGAGDTVSARVEQAIGRYLDARYRMDDYKREIGRIERELADELNKTLAQNFGLRVKSVEIFDRSQPIAEVLFDFQDRYRIIGTTRVLEIEHRGAIRCFDSGKAAGIDPNRFRDEVIEWIKLETAKYLQGKTLADIVEVFCSNEEVEENKLREYLGQRVNERARGRGFTVAPIIAVSQNVHERELVTGREFVTPMQEYALSLAGSKTELTIYARISLAATETGDLSAAARKLRPYLRDEVNLDEVVATKISGFVARELQTVNPEDFYISDVANHGGKTELREKWTDELSAELISGFGLKVEGLRFGRGRDPIRDRFYRLLNATVTHQFDRTLPDQDGSGRPLRFVVQFQVIGADRNSWNRFQSKALAAASAQEQLDEVRQRIEAMYDIRIHARPSFDLWRPQYFVQHVREELRVELEGTIAREFGLEIEVPVDGLFTMDVDPFHDRVLLEMHRAREELELERVKRIRSDPLASDDWGSGFRDELKQIEERVQILDTEIRERHKKIYERQLEIMCLEQERHKLLQDPSIAMPRLLPGPRDESAKDGDIARQ